ncbi:DUF2653 family protein [Paenibacillus chartarius]|uniref:DUF2653 family protein n=1 Tax=Paenibacillus chartarius TaxID=747481 RepID=A0ABV6DK88_9BACL
MFDEPDVIDAACVYVAQTYRVPIERLQAELRYEEAFGIRGTVELAGERRMFDLSEQDLIDGAAMYLASYHAFDPHQLSVELLFNEEEGITAVAQL